MIKIRFLALGLALAILTGMVIPMGVVATESSGASGPSIFADPSDNGDGGGVLNTGFLGKYYDNADFNGEPVFERRDVRIAFDWGEHLPVGGSISAPYNSFPKDNFSILWEGVVLTKFTETYSFYTYGDGGARVSIKKESEQNWNVIIDTRNQESDEYQWSTAGQHPMEYDVRYDIKIEYKERTGKAAIKLYWESDSVPCELIDPTMELGYNIVNWRQGFTDLVKSARNTWIDSDKQGTNEQKVTDKVDEDGWPMIKNGEYIFQEAMQRGMGLDPLRHGTISYSFKGKADISVNGNVGLGSGTFERLNSTYNEETNTTTGTFVAVDKGINATSFFFKNATRNGKEDGPPGITDLKLMGPDRPGTNADYSTTSYAEDTLFLPQFKELYGSFTVIRVHFNNASQERYWEERTTPTYFNQARGKKSTRKYVTSSATDPVNNFLSWEHKIMLCNEIGKDLFLNTALMSTLDNKDGKGNYVEKLANLIKYGSDGKEPYTSVQENPVYPPLNSNLRVYIEIGNELWNFSGDDYRNYWDLEGMVKDDILAGNEDFAIVNYDNLPVVESGNTYTNIATWRYRKIGLLLVKTSNIFREVFGDSQMISRIRPMYEWQYANHNGTAARCLEFLDNYFNNADGIKHVEDPKPVNYYLWGGGGATYYGAKNPNGLTDIVPNSSFEEQVISESDGYIQNPTDSIWEFTGTAGIAKNGSKLGNPVALVNNNTNLGTQMAYIKGNGSMKVTITIPENALDEDVYAISFKAVNRVVGSAANNQKLQVLMDGVDMFQRNFSQTGPYYAPPGYNASYPWRARNVSWVWSEYYVTKTTLGTGINTHNGTTHTIEINGMTDGDHIAFIDDFRVTSASAIIESDMPYKGEATGQTSVGEGIILDMTIASMWAKMYGLKYITYEGGWSLGGDDDGSPLQNHVKHSDPRVKGIQATAIDYFHNTGGKLNIYGTYYDWPNWDDNYAEEGMVDLSKYPLFQGTADRFNNLAAPITVGVEVPGTLDGMNCMEKGFDEGILTNFKTNSFRNEGSKISSATYALRASEPGLYNLSIKLRADKSESIFELKVNQDPTQTIIIPEMPYTHDNNIADSIPVTINLKRGLNSLRLFPKGFTDTDITSLTISKGPASDVEPTEIKVIKTNASGTAQDNLVKMTKTHKVGDVITLVATDTTFKSASTNSDSLATVTRTTTYEGNDTLTITCTGKGLAVITARDNTNDKMFKVHILIDYNEPKGLSLWPSGESDGLLPVIVSSAARNFEYRHVFNGLLATGANFSWQTAKMPSLGTNPNSNHFIIQRFVDSYAIENFQLYFQNPPGSTTMKLPTHISVELCDNPYPDGYKMDTSLNVPNTVPPYVSFSTGNFTEYYDFSGTAVRFNDGDATIKSDFETKINNWEWKKLYEGTPDFVLDGGQNNMYFVIISKDKIINYLKSQNTDQLPTGYFIRFSFSYSNESTPWNDTADQYALLSLMMDSKVAREADLELPDIMPTVANDTIEKVRVYNVSEGTLKRGDYIIAAKYDSADRLSTVKMVDVSDVEPADDILEVDIGFDISNANNYKLFFWNLNNLSSGYRAYASK